MYPRSPESYRNFGNTLSIVLIFLAVIVLVGVLYTYNNPEFKKLLTNTRNITSVVESIKQDVAKDPFYDITIDYLQDREYESNLGELQKVSENAKYTAYLTSYNSDGLKVNGYLTLPKGEMPDNGWPAIVFIHGYIPPTLYKTQSKYESYVNSFANSGLVVFKIDLRGHDNSEGEASGAYYSGDYIVDTLNAYSALQNYKEINKDKIGLWGHSMAGNVVLRSVVAKKDIPAVVIWAGAGYTYEDLSAYGIDDNSYRPPETNTERQKRREQLKAEHGDFSVTSDFWKRVVPTNYLNDVNGTAIQIHHAIDDTVVSVEYSRNLDKILNNANIKHELYEYSSGGHNITGSSFTSAIQRSVDFFKNNL